jgi:hypothetical protein
LSVPKTVQELNRELADKINEEALRNPQSPYANKFVSIANGQVVVVADDLGELFRRLRQIEPNPSKCFGVEASRNYDEIVEIWELIDARRDGERRFTPGSTSPHSPPRP